MEPSPWSVVRGRRWEGPFPTVEVMPAPAAVVRNLREYFALDDEWERPGGRIGTGDITLVVVIATLSLFVLELMRSIGSLDQVPLPVWAQWLMTVGPVLPLVARRRWPLTVAVVVSATFFAISRFNELMVNLMSTQVVYFVAILSGVAWARSRVRMAQVMMALVAVNFIWLTWEAALGNALGRQIPDEVRSGLFSAPVAAVLLAFVVNIAYWGGALLWGNSLWRSARQQAHLAEQAETIAAQADSLRDQAVVDERLRIARELHDVVAHHVAVIGVQAAAGRRVLDGDPDAAKGALLQIEQSSREAVTQMRGLLGTLRAAASAQGGPSAQGVRAPMPGLADVAALGTSYAPGLEVVLDLVEHAPDASDAVPAAIGRSLYCTAQEALTNVVKHSTATRARLVVRVQPHYAEVEVTDEGRPRPGTLGSGLGQTGIRERARSHGGSVEIGPRALGGYRVRLRIPTDGCAAS